MTATPTAIYRFFDVADRLLYVGITGDLLARWGWHRRWSPWWPAQARIEVAWRPDRATADAEETLAIRNEAPIHNLAKRGPRRPERVPGMPPEWDDLVDQARAGAAESRRLEEAAWEAILEARAAGVPDDLLCQTTGFSRSTLNRRYGSKKASA